MYKKQAEKNESQHKKENIQNQYFMIENYNNYTLQLAYNNQESKI